MNMEGIGRSFGSGPSEPCSGSHLGEGYFLRRRRDLPSRECWDLGEVCWGL